LPNLLSILQKEDIPAEYLGTPIAELLEYQNLGKAYLPQEEPSLLVAMCMDSRKKLQVPNNFAFVIRTGGANMREMEFKVSYLISLLDLKYIALIGHNDCRMVNLIHRREDYINGMVKNAGWDVDKAAAHFEQFAPLYNIEDEAAFILREQERLVKLFPKLIVVPMIYNVQDSALSIIR
jgi:carbonic anhydrase